MRFSELTQRALTGVIFVAILLGGILLNKYSFFLLFVAILILAMNEFCGLLNMAYRAGINRTFTILGGVLLYVSSYLYFSSSLPFAISTPFIASFFLWLITLFVVELYAKKENPIKSLAYSLLGIMYIALPISFSCYLAFNYNPSSYHYGYILALFVFIWINDSFAYVVGSLLGKHRLFERISPKKSWEGFVGGLIFTVIASTIYAHFFPEREMWIWIGIALIVVIVGTLGDLLESLFKRTLGVKDSGNILPGHGGILDRFDSMLFSILPIVIFLKIVDFILN